jgi:hypothetical protein
LAKATVAKEGATISISAAATRPTIIKLVLACVILFNKIGYRIYESYREF